MSEAHAPPKHPYHLVAPSPWPLVGAVAAGLLTTGAVLFMHGYGWTLMIIGFLSVLAIMAVWWRDVIREATFQGYHTPVVQLGLRYGLALTVFLGLCFTSVQAWEYSHAPFHFTDGIYPSTFFMATGFHGFHVIIGTCFLAVCLWRATQGHFKPDHHFGLEAAAWYWHFVDVVWLFLFDCIYWWGMGNALPAGVGG